MSSKVKNSESIPIIGIDLGTIFSCVAIRRNGKIEIIEEKETGEKIIPSMVCYKVDNDSYDLLIGGSAKNNMIQYAETTMYESKRLLGYKYSHKLVQEDIKNWPVKIIEDIKTKKPQYVINIGKEEKKFYPEDVSSMILKYLKKIAIIHNSNKEIKKAVITVPARFTNLQREATIKAAKDAGLEVFKLINEPTAAAIAYGDIIKSDKERKVLIFDLGGGTFDVTILKIKGSEYNVLASIGEEHLGGEDFNQRIINYVMGEIKKNDKFKNIDFMDKKNKRVINALRNIRIKTENVKIDLSKLDKTNFFIDYLYGIEDFNLEITRNQYENLCIDLWEKCIKILDDAIKLSKLKKEEIDEIILVGGSTRTPKIKQMVQKYFNGKEPLQNINPDEVVAYGAALVPYLNLKIQDIISKPIGIKINHGIMCNIIPVGTVLPFQGSKNFTYSRTFSFGDNMDSNKQIIRIYQGENEKAGDNHFLGMFVVNVNEKEKNKIIKISMSIDYNNILNVAATIEDEKKNQIGIKMLFNE